MKDNKLCKVLFLSAWYPNRYDEMWGLFVQNHAIACSKFVEVAVLYVHPVKDLQNKLFEINISYEPFLVVRIYYSNNFQSKFPIINHFCKLYYYSKAYRIGFRYIQHIYGNYNLIHVNILTRTACVAYLKKLFSGKKYIVTEHWSRYLPNVNTYKGFLRKILTRIVVNQADAITTVTENLRDAMLARKLKNSNYQIVPNVVDTDLFSCLNIDNTSVKRILHVSCFEDRSKNISGLLRVCRRIQEYRNDFKLIMVGDGIDKIAMEQYAAELKISSDKIEFLGILTGKDLVEQYQLSSFFTLFSNYENFPVVIAESLVCGKPVVATKVGGIAEFVDDSNGILVNANDEISFENAIIKMLDKFSNYDKVAISESAVSKFSQQAVGKQFYEIYSKVLS